MVGEALLHNAIDQLSPGNGEDRRGVVGEGVVKLSSLGKHVERDFCSVKSIWLYI